MVSVIVPVYNVEKYLARCLDSLLNQTVDDYEIICVDDCGTDSSSEILLEYELKNPNKIQLVHNLHNIGLGPAREEGLKIAKGDYVMFVDSDDYVKPDYVEKYLNEMLASPVDILAGGYIRDIDGHLVVHKISDSEWSTLTYAISCAKMFRKSFLEKNDIQFLKIDCGEDIYFSLCCFYYGAIVRSFDYQGYFYYLNRSSITGSMNHRKNHEQMMNNLFETFIEKHDLSVLSDDRQQMIEYTYLANMLNSLLVFNKGCGSKEMKKKYVYFKKNLTSKFPNYKRNPYVGFFKPKDQTVKIRLGVGVSMRLDRYGMFEPLLKIVSYL